MRMLAFNQFEKLQIEITSINVGIFANLSLNPKYFMCLHVHTQ